MTYCDRLDYSFSTYLFYFMENCGVIVLLILKLLVLNSGEFPFSDYRLVITPLKPPDALQF